MKKIYYFIVIELTMVLCAIGALIGIQSLSGLPVMSAKKFFVVNIVLLYVIYKLFYLIFNRLWLAALIPDIIFYLLAVGNHYTFEFRGIMLVPWDLLALGTAADVAGGYEYRLYAGEFIWLLIIATSVFAMYKLEKKYAANIKAEASKDLIKNRLIYTGISLVVCVFLMSSMMSSEVYRSIPDRLYQIDRYYKNQGMPISFFNYSKFLYTKAPDGYELEKCQEIASEYDSEEIVDSAVVPQNVIAIMNESLTDFSQIGSIPEVEAQVDFMNSLVDNTIKGNLYVPVYGGTTVNSEYEFLTGNSIAFMKGCPFSYAVREDRPSVARVFEENGYEVHGMHPATPENWGRKTVYPYLGLEDFISLDQLAPLNLDVVNDHTTDAADYAQIIKAFENKKSDKFFMFNVTMQNHSGYGFDFEEQTGMKAVDLSGYGDMPEAETYLSLLGMSDDAFKELIDYFSTVEEPTLICMFGDHQPKIEDEFLTVLDPSFDGEDPEDNIKKYTTPFIIWANYDIKEQYVDRMSSNYLSELLLETAGIKLPAYYGLLKELRMQYPVLSVNGVYDKDNRFLAVDEIDTDSLVEKYRFMEYNNANAKTKDVLWDAFR